MRRRGPGKYRRVLGSLSAIALLTSSAGAAQVDQPRAHAPAITERAPDVQAWIDHQIREHRDVLDGRLRMLQYLLAQSLEQLRGEQSPARIAMIEWKVAGLRRMARMFVEDHEHFRAWVAGRPEALMGVAPVIAVVAITAGGEGGPAPQAVHGRVNDAAITAACAKADCLIRSRGLVDGATPATRISTTHAIDGEVFLDAAMRGANFCHVFKDAGVCTVEVTVMDNAGLSSAWTTTDQVTVTAQANRTQIFVRSDGNDAQAGTSNTAGGAVLTLNGAFGKCVAAGVHYWIRHSSGNIAWTASASPAGVAGSIYVTRDGAELTTLATGITGFTPGDGCRNVMFEGLDLRAGGADNNTLMVCDGVDTTGITFIGCETGAGANGFAGVFVTTGTGVLTGWGLINHLHDTTTTSGQGIFSSQATDVCVWGTEWLGDADGQQLARFAGAEDGDGDFITINFSTFDKGGNANSPLRVYVATNCWIYRCTVMNTSDSTCSLGMSNDEGDGPSICACYVIDGCLFIECGTQGHTRMRDFRVRDCYIRTSAGHRSLGLSDGAFAEADDYPDGVQLITTVVESEGDAGGVAGDAFAADAGDFCRNFGWFACLWVVPNTYSEAYLEFIVSSANAALNGYLADGNGYRKNDVVAWEEFGDTSTVAQLNLLSFAGTDYLEVNTVDPVTGEPDGTTVQTGGRPVTQVGSLQLGTFQSYNGTWRNPDGATCWSGGYQPGHASPTDLVVTERDGEVELAWAAAAGAEDYIVHVGTADGWSEQTVEVAGTGTTIPGDNGTTLYFRVLARNVGSLSAALEGSGTPTADGGGGGAPAWPPDIRGGSRRLSAGNLCRRFPPAIQN